MEIAHHPPRVREGFDRRFCIKTMIGEDVENWAMQHGAARVLDTRANLESQVDHQMTLCSNGMRRFGARV